MKNILILAGIAGLAAAIAIYFVSDSYDTSTSDDYITDVDKDAYELAENTGLAESI